MFCAALSVVDGRRGGSDRDATLPEAVGAAPAVAGRRIRRRRDLPLPVPPVPVAALALKPVTAEDGARGKSGSRSFPADGITTADNCGRGGIGTGTAAGPDGTDGTDGTRLTTTYPAVGVVLETTDVGVPLIAPTIPVGERKPPPSVGDVSEAAAPIGVGPGSKSSGSDLY